MIYFNEKLSDFMYTPDGIDLYFENGKQVATEYLIASDGINSNIRKQIQPMKNYAMLAIHAGEVFSTIVPTILKEGFPKLGGQKVALESCLYQEIGSIGMP